MITGDNYKQLRNEYARLKSLAIRLGLTADGFIEQVVNRTAIGMVYINFFDKLTDGKDIPGAIKDFVEIVYNQKVTVPLEFEKKKK